MATASIQPFNEKAAQVWSSGGHGYEIIAQQCLPGIVHAVDRLAPHPGEQVIDVGTGTGRAAREVATRGARAIGVDIAEGMLNAARAQTAQQGIDLRLADAETLPFEDAAFDKAISTFGVMFSVQPHLATSELARVLRPGGRLAVTAWTPNSNAVLMRQELAPFAPPPPDPAPPAPWAWGTEEGLQEYLGTDFDFEFETGVLHFRYPDAEAFWQTFASMFGPMKAVVDSLDADRREELAAALRRWAEAFRASCGVSIPCEYVLTVAHRK